MHEKPQATGIALRPYHDRLIVRGMEDVFRPQAVQDSLAVIRRAETPREEFVRHSDRIFRLMGVRLAEDLPVVTERITTPVGPAEVRRTDSSGVLLVAILRSGLPATEGIRESLPQAKRALIDIKRDEDTSEPILFYDGLPENLGEFGKVIVPDPMLATGGSASMAIGMLKERGAGNIHLVALVAAPEGMRRIRREHPDVRITTTAVDDKLNGRNYIDPGLGDFGDRYYEGDSLVIMDHNTGRNLGYKEGHLI